MFAYIFFSFSLFGLPLLSFVISFSLNAFGLGFVMCVRVSIWMHIDVLVLGAR